MVTGRFSLRPDAFCTERDWLRITHDNPEEPGSINFAIMLDGVRFELRSAVAGTVEETAYGGQVTFIRHPGPEIRCTLELEGFGVLTTSVPSFEGIDEGDELATHGVGGSGSDDPRTEYAGNWSFEPDNGGSPQTANDLPRFLAHFFEAEIAA